MRKVAVQEKYNFFFDLDGTITRKEILPEIGKKLNIYHEIKRLTYQTIRGEIPFHESFLKRVKILSTVPISTIRNIINNIPLNNHILTFIKENASRCYIATGNLDVWIQDLCNTIGVQYFSSIAHYKNDRIIGVKQVLDKSKIHSLVKGPYVAIGEGHNDAAMIGKANIGIAFGGVHRPAKTVMDEATHTIYDEKLLCKFLRRLL
jgi:HAD superfamily phosphoserine phosphatase-like hydrolase